MNILRKLLFPFSLIYGLITKIRNVLFDKGVLKSYSFDVPVIAIGNLSVGGTGKTPQIEYLIRLLGDKYKIATLSRGYKRETKGFVLADSTASVKSIGDEPFQFYTKFPNVQVAVDADRKNGIEQLLLQKEKPNIILLDDAFQHRKVKASLYILLTTYSELYCNDWILPTGNLRESSSGAQRAQIVIVTKCPKNLSVDEQNSIRAKLKIAPNQELYFSCIAYDDAVFGENKSLKIYEINNRDKLLLAGIAKPEPFFDFLKSNGDQCLQFPDHHNFTESDILDIKKQAENRIIVTTEKDFVRLKDSILASQLYYLPIKSSFVDGGSRFDESIMRFVENKK
jgi:tetraacyldisaccharide 4'-kinase